MVKSVGPPYLCVLWRIVGRFVGGVEGFLIFVILV
jgi:hypothetical protein